MRNRIAVFLRKLFGWGMFSVLMAGALCFLGYVLALVLGGSAAGSICAFLYERFIPVLIYAVNVLILLGVLTMYLCGEKALTADAKSECETEC